MLVHISGIGADPGSDRRRRARAVGSWSKHFQELPSPERDVWAGRVFNQLAALSRVMPIFHSSARNVKLQPYTGDVAEAVAGAGTEVQRQDLRLGGLTLHHKALLQLLLKQLGRKRLLMPFPILLGTSWPP
jgi:hypothetical protein